MRAKAKALPVDGITHIQGGQSIAATVPPLETSPFARLAIAPNQLNIISSTISARSIINKLYQDQSGLPPFYEQFEYTTFV